MCGEAQENLSDLKGFYHLGTFQKESRGRGIQGDEEADLLKKSEAIYRRNLEYRYLGFGEV